MTQLRHRDSHQSREGDNAGDRVMRSPAWGHCLRALSALLLMDLSLALVEVHMEQKLVSAVEGQSITIPVWYSSISEEKPTVQWLLERNQMQGFQILTYINGEVTVDAGFKDRVSFAHAMPSRNISIIIKKTIASDTGKYSCLVNVKNDSYNSGSNSGVAEVSILVPPAKPTCRIQGSPYIGANVTLLCSSSSGQPNPTYTWIKKSTNNVVFFPPAHDSVKGTLALTNLTSDSSGTYMCTSRNTAGVAECNITMEVTSAYRVAIIVGAVIGSIVGLCCLAILITGLLYLYRRQKKEAQDEIENDIKEDAAAPKTLTWAKANGSDLTFKNGTLSSINSNRDHKPYPPKSPSDTTSINTAIGSTAGYRPPYISDRGGVSTPTPSMSSQSLPSYMVPANGNYYTTAVPTSRNPTQKTNGAEQQAPRKDLNMASGVTSSNLVRMGAVPVMVPAQSQAGSLV